MLVRNVTAGPFEGLAKEDLPGQLCAVTAGVLRAEAQRDPGHYDLVHSHYWLSGQVGWLAKERWGVPLVHSMHTMAQGQERSPSPRATPPSRRCARSARSRWSRSPTASWPTRTRRRPELVRLYGADPDKVAVVAPGVDLERFAPGSQRTARESIGVPADAVMLLFVGRIQPLKAPDVLIRSARPDAQRPARAARPAGRAVVGGPSGTGLAHPTQLQDLAIDLGVDDIVRFTPPVPQDRLPTSTARPT